jgi:hypothetical protein
MRMRILLFSALMASPTVFAAGKHEGPCQKVLQACEAGGYKVGAHKKTGKGAYIDCLNKLVAGQTVEGVTADPGEVAKCKAHKDKHKKK